MKRILVIDDDPALRELVTRALQLHGYEPLEAPDGLSGLELARAQRPDLIISDIMMDNGDGYQVLAHLREHPATAGVPLILMTGDPRSGHMRRGMEGGADDFLPKPFTVDTLLAAVDTRLQKQAAFRQHAEAKLAHVCSALRLGLPRKARSALTEVLSFGAALGSGATSNDEATLSEIGDKICGAARRLQRWIQSVLIFAQIELLSTDPKSIELLRKRRTPDGAELVSTIARRIAFAAHRQFDLKLSLSPTAVTISPELFSKIIEELVSNAFEFSPPQTPVRVSLVEDARWACLLIQDHGPGLNLAEANGGDARMLFNHGIHDNGGGGLGLTIARRLTELHAGNFHIESNPGRGSRVTVRLPAAE
ncbi:MAG: response regulator [Verrucomicrobia bacterium]|nr:response regulator [Verrucomicrobiota bacterium]